MTLQIAGTPEGRTRRLELAQRDLVKLLRSELRRKRSTGFLRSNLRVLLGLHTLQPPATEEELDALVQTVPGIERNEARYVITNRARAEEYLKLSPKISQRGHGEKESQILGWFKKQKEEQRWKTVEEIAGGGETENKKVHTVLKRLVKKGEVEAYRAGLGRTKYRKKTDSESPGVG